MLLNLETQKEHYESYIRSNDEWKYAGLYFDEGISGTSMRKRDGLKRLVDDCDKGLIDIVLTKSISRFCRNTTDCLAIVRKMGNIGVTIIFEKEKITEHVCEIAPYLEEKLDALMAKYDFITARRGMGLIQGLEMTIPVGQVSSKALEQGLIVITAGSNVIRFVPPLVIEKEHVDEMAEILDRVLAEF